jgi:citronellyl-CoA dehydrogenase
MQQFQHERFAAIPMSYVSAEETIAMTVEHIKKRIVFGKPLIARQVLRHRLADWQTEIECLRQLTYHIVRMKEAGMDVTREVSMGKLFAARTVKKVADGCLQMYGGLGFSGRPFDIHRWRDR